MDRTVNIMVSLILLAYPVLSIPSILKAKREKGNYFSESRMFIPKRVGYGIGLNMHNCFGFFTLFFIGLLFLILGIFF